MGRRAETADVEALYRERYRHFLRVAVLIVRDRERALDAVQEGFAAAIRSLHSYRGEGPLEAWVWRAVVNAAREQLRHPLAAAAGAEDAAALQNGDALEARAVRAWIASLRAPAPGGSYGPCPEGVTP